MFRNDRGAALVEAAIALPFFIISTVGVVDLGTGMYEAMAVNAAAQTGAAYAVLNKGSTSAPSSLLRAAADNIPTIAVTPVTCTDPSGGFCVSLQASQLFTPILHAAQLTKFVPWLPPSLTMTSTATVRIQ
jgi:Flp pilus assembly protein TadG